MLVGEPSQSKGVAGIMSIMTIHCPDCGIPVPAEQVNLDTGLAKCLTCNAVFNVKDRMELRKQRGRTASAQIVPRPAKMKVEQFAGSWTVSWRWFGFQYVAMFVFCIAWDSFLIFWYKMAFRDEAPWIMIVFPVGHVAVGVGLTYTALAGFLNRTRLILGHGQLTVRHGPLPWWGNRDMATADIRQFYCEESRVRNNQGSGYQLSAMLKDGRKVKILSGFWSWDEAKFLECELESRLGIKPQTVVGERR